VVGNLDYEPLYRRMVDTLLGLRSEGIPIESLLDVFKDVEGSLYADPIHLGHDQRGESAGYRLMAKEVAHRLGEAWGLRARR
jgi:hypothetical protein